MFINTPGFLSYIKIEFWGVFYGTRADGPGDCFPSFLSNLHILPDDMKHEEKRFAWQQRTDVVQWETDGIQSPGLLK